MALQIRRTILTLLKRQAIACTLLCTAHLVAQAAPESYYEFGTILAVGQNSVDLQSYSQDAHGLIRQTFLMTPDTRADLVRLGDQVEVIYTAESGSLQLRRLLLLTAGVPRFGPPSNSFAQRTPPPQAVPSQPQVAAATTPPAPIVRSTPKPKPAPRTKPAKSTPSSAPARKSTPDTSVSLAANVAPRPSTLIPTTLGAGSAATSPKPILPRPVIHDTPGQECQRSSDDWPSRPLSIAVLDFRYPTDREESHDIALVGGGSGTAVADLIYNRLAAQPEFTVDRGDRRRLDRTDIAGAARLGRQMGVDAVLAGTFNPIDQPPYDDGTSRPPIYELRAGLVDTCTGQVLMKLASETCVPGTDSNACRQTITARQASNPAAFAQAFQAPVDTLLYPLEHNSTDATPEPDAAGVITSSSASNVTLHLNAGAHLRPGDQLAVHASRLTKNPSTYTLNILHDQEIGRITIRSVQGASATAAFTGDITPRPGDTAQPISTP